MPRRVVRAAAAAAGAAIKAMAGGGGGGGERKPPKEMWGKEVNPKEGERTASQRLRMGGRGAGERNRTRQKKEEKQRRRDSSGGRKTVVEGCAAGVGEVQTTPLGGGRGGASDGERASGRLSSQRRKGVATGARAWARERSATAAGDVPRRSSRQSREKKKTAPTLGGLHMTHISFQCLGGGKEVDHPSRHGQKSND